METVIVQIPFHFIFGEEITVVNNLETYASVNIGRLEDSDLVCSRAARIIYYFTDSTDGGLNLFGG
jgi:hypothetical protein